MNLFERILSNSIGVLLVILIVRYIVEDFNDGQFLSAIILLTIMLLTIVFVIIKTKNTNSILRRNYSNYRLRI